MTKVTERTKKHSSSQLLPSLLSTCRPTSDDDFFSK